MSTPKTKYVLGRDDLIRSEFFTRPNAEQLVTGINASGTTKLLAVDVGGTGTKSSNLINQRILYYDSTTGTIKSSDTNNHNLTVGEVDLTDYALKSAFRGEDGDSFLQVSWANILNRDAPRSRLVRAYRTADADMPLMSSFMNATSPYLTSCLFEHGLGVVPDFATVDFVCLAQDTAGGGNFEAGKVVRMEDAWQYFNGGYHRFFMDYGGLAADDKVVCGTFFYVRNNSGTDLYPLYAGNTNPGLVLATPSAVSTVNSTGLITLTFSSAHGQPDAVRVMISGVTTDPNYNGVFDLVSKTSTTLVLNANFGRVPANGSLNLSSNTGIRVKAGLYMGGGYGTAIYRTDPTKWSLRCTAISVQPA